MNERIRELADQVRVKQNEEFDSRLGWTTQEWRSFYDKKFAELIVKECICLVEKNKPDEIQRKEFPTDFIEGWENNSEVVIEDLMLHFGVNE